MSDQERVARIGLLSAMAVAAALILYFSRGLTFTADELVWLIESPNLDLETALQPHGGHLTLTARIVYKAMFEVFGDGYLPFRLLGMATVLLTVGALFAYARRRVGGLVALAPCLVLLVFGSDTLHVLHGNGFTVVGALGCGIGALLALDRRDLAGNLIACALLCLGVATYTVALAFVAAVAVAVLLEDDRWRRIWIPAVPTVLYGAWWLWSLGETSSGGEATDLSNSLLFPVKAFQACGAVLGALTGLDLPSLQVAAGAGPALALVALAALLWRLHRETVPNPLWAMLALPIALWGLISVAKLRSPVDPRYLFPGSIAVVLVAVEAIRGVRWSGFALAVLFGASIAGASTNLWLLRESGASLKNADTAQARAELMAIDLGGANLAPAFSPADRLGSDSTLLYPFAEVRARGTPPTTGYLSAASEYGALGYSAAEIAGQPEVIRARTDSVLADGLGLELVQSLRPPAGGGCRLLRSAGGAGIGVDLPPGGAVLEAGGQGGEVAVRRFGSARVPLGALAPKQPAKLKIPQDAEPTPWQLVTAATPLRVCPIR